MVRGGKPLVCTMMFVASYVAGLRDRHIANAFQSIRNSIVKFF